MRLLLLSVSLLLNFPAAAFAECDCIWGGPFTEVQGGADIVIAGTVISAKGNSVDLTVDQLMRGAEYLPEIRVWMNPGQLCRPESEEFPMGSQWVMALHRVEQLAPGDFNPRTPNRSAGRVGDYSLSSCGGYWLSLSGNLVSGNLAGGGRWQRDPPMSPVLLELVTAFTEGSVDAATLRQASTIDPELQRLQLETRVLLRRQNRRSELEQAQ